MDLIQKISRLKKEHNAVILAHTYQPGEIQDIADFVGDSYGLSVEAARVESADCIIFCGVRFMAETAAILNPSRTVILPEPGAGCPMAAMINPGELLEFKKKYPRYQVVCYVNSTAEIKAMSDICCTSSNALKIIRQIPRQTGIIFIPDKHLGSWVQEQTGHTMILWDGFCPTHMLLFADLLVNARKRFPDAKLLIHPEAEKECRDLADAVLSTGGMAEYVRKSDAGQFIIATETGIIHTLKKQNPDKEFFPAGPEVVCPNMKKTTLQSVVKALENTGGEIIAINEAVAKMARVALQKMLDMSKQAA
jgi:quinolinate synthase